MEREQLIKNILTDINNSITAADMTEIERWQVLDTLQGHLFGEAETLLARLIRASDRYERHKPSTHL